MESKRWEKDGKVTVLLPIKNGASYLPKISINIQKNIKASDEILAIDDHSTDKTLTFLKQWQKENPQVRVLQPKESGLVNALNLGIRESSNCAIARYDVDDKYSLNRLELQRTSIHETTAAIFCDYLICKNNIKIGVIPSAIKKEMVSLSLVSSQRTPHPGVLFNREAVIEVGGYRKEDFPAEDLSLWLRLSRIGDLISIPEALLYYQLSVGSISKVNKKLIKEKTKLLRKNIGINLDDLDYCTKNLDNILSFYDKFSFSHERKMLFVKELLFASTVYKKKIRIPASFIREFKDFDQYIKSAKKLIEIKVKK